MPVGAARCGTVIAVRCGTIISTVFVTLEQCKNIGPTLFSSSCGTETFALLVEGSSTDKGVSIGITFFNLLRKLQKPHTDNSKWFPARKTGVWQLQEFSEKVLKGVCLIEERLFSPRDIFFSGRARRRDLGGGEGKLRRSGSVLAFPPCCREAVAFLFASSG